MMAPSEDIHVASHGGTRLPWRGRSALPVRLATRSWNPESVEVYQTRSPGIRTSSTMVRKVSEYRGASTAGNAVFPNPPRGVGHHVERPRLGVEREAFPFRAGGSPEAEFAG